MFDTEGKKECPHCNGYGSSLKDRIGINTCTKCHGSGLVPDNKFECERCKIRKELSEIEIMHPKQPDNIEQCHPFMDMKIICIDCVEEKDYA